MRLIFMYVLLVGAPALGVMSILHIGRDLKPPAAVSGVWNVEADLGRLGNSPCAELLTTMKQPALTISQSGRQVVLQFNNDEKTSLGGELEGNVVTAGTPPDARAEGAACRGADAIYLKAELRKDSVPVQLNGQLALAGCRECPQLTFSATRQQPPRAGERRH